ncbi:hypothetical protein [Streptomyces sp. A012304]|uniref:hypothetical protein n=1 Tax=Streptomyces sp. A012304 TaxID=375446 RepID=UPI00222E61E6|nr:hypothetical protein [Streptomyces sp. A012304]GKQ33811.1 hypothetical protein ALMP_03620 [Streptomyces sp. A012304]
MSSSAPASPDPVASSHSQVSSESQVSSDSLASSEAIRAFLVEQVNSMLRRLGMYGGEPALWAALRHLSFVEQGTEAWERQWRTWLERAGRATGVRGVFRDMSPGHRVQEDALASVYAEFARGRGWLVPDRVLDADACARVRDRARAWAGEDRTWSDVTTEFGEPALTLGGTNPLYGKTLGYFGADPAQPAVWFHLHNGAEPEGEWPPKRAEPVLLAVRCGEDGPLDDTFTFTPEGWRLMPENDGCGHHGWRRPESPIG